MRKDGTLRFGDFVAIILNLTVAFCKLFFFIHAMFVATLVAVMLRFSSILPNSLNFLRILLFQLCTTGRILRRTALSK